jgi:hypothetical protein
MVYGTYLYFGYWLDAYGEFLKNAPKMTQDWYDIFWKPYLNWAPQQQDRD